VEVSAASENLQLCFVRRGWR